MEVVADDCQLMLLGAGDAGGLARRIEELRGSAERMPGAELGDLAEQLHGSLPEAPRLRAAVVAASPSELGERLGELAAWLEDGEPPQLRLGRGGFIGAGERPPRIGFLFPGQGAPVHARAGALADRFPEAGGVHAEAGLPADAREVPTACVQLSIVASSLAAMRVLQALGIRADLAVGHSLGELTALHWAGALDSECLVRTARARGEAMTAHAGGNGAMASIRTGDEEAFAQLLDGLDVTVACFNSPTQRVVSGAVEAVDSLVARAKEIRVRAIRLKVVGAFHSALMEAAVPVFERHLGAERLGALTGRVISTVTGAELDPNTDLRALLARQIREPVRFVEAARAAAAQADLLLEVGPGKILAGLLSELADTPAVSMRAGESSLKGVLTAAAAAYAAGAPVDPSRLIGTVRSGR